MAAVRTPIGALTKIAKLAGQTTHAQRHTVSIDNWQAQTLVDFLDVAHQIHGEEATI
jgi:hypothetical protein